MLVYMVIPYIGFMANDRLIIGYCYACIIIRYWLLLCMYNYTGIKGNVKYKKDELICKFGQY